MDTFKKIKTLVLDLEDDFSRASNENDILAIRKVEKGMEYLRSLAITLKYELAFDLLDKPKQKHG